VPYTGISIDDTLTDVVDDATYNNDAVAQVVPAGPTGTIGLAGSTLTWTGDLAVGAVLTITYTVTVKTSGFGNRELNNSVVSAAAGSTCTAVLTSGCFVAVPVLRPELTIATDADTPTATPGTTVTYTVTIANRGELPYTGTSVTLDLTSVVDDATYNNDASATAGTVGYSAPLLTWTGDLAVGATTTVTFTATVNNPPLGDQTLVMVASSTAEGNNCPSGSTDPDCRVTVVVVAVQTLTITKSTTGDLTVASPGEVVHYTITLANSAVTPFTDATFTDALSDVLDDATYNNDVSQVVVPTAPQRSSSTRPTRPSPGAARCRPRER
jgi:uncharacterized repeat protein (TIGR01451 family)